MKYDWLSGPRKPVPCEIVVDGEIHDLLLLPLRFADVLVSQELAAASEGDTPDDTARKNKLNAYFLAALGLGRENFEATDPAALAAELEAKGVPEPMEITKIANALIERYSITAEQIREAAKDSVRPTESAA